MTKDKSLKSKAIDIKGKQYVLVSDRILYFNDNYPNGAIVTEVIENNEREEFKATVWPDVYMPERKFTGHSQATWGEGMVNKTAATENAETSAVGRALAMMGIGVIESIASADEMNKSMTQKPYSNKTRHATMKQIELLVNKVKWGTGLYDKDEIINFLDETIGKPINTLLANEVDDAIAKIDQAVRKDKVNNKVSKVDDVVTEVPEEEFNLDNVPY